MTKQIVTKIHKIKNLVENAGFFYFAENPACRKKKRKKQYDCYKSLIKMSRINKKTRNITSVSVFGRKKTNGKKCILK